MPSLEIPERRARSGAGRRAVLVSWAYENRNYWIAAGREDQLVPHSDGSARGRAQHAESGAYGDRERARRARAEARRDIQAEEKYFATIEYVDVGGLQKDREKNSASLVPLREADALAHVVRLFENPAVPHEGGSLDAMRDIESVDIELMLSDLEQASKRIERVEKDLKKKKDPVLETELALLKRCRRRWNRKSRCANWNSSPKN